MDHVTQLNVPDAMHLAQKLYADRLYAEALALFAAVAKTEGAPFQAINGAGLCLIELDRDAEALPFFDQAFAILQSETAALMANRAKALAAVGRVREALEIYNGLVRAMPRGAFVRNGRGLTLLQMGMHLAAIADFDAVLALEPGNDVARFARGFANLVLGNYAEGFRDYEHRLKDVLDEPDVPLWTGKEDLAGKAILVHGEMGLGDNIMFMRYVPMLQARGADVVVVVPQSQRALVPAGCAWRLADKASWPRLDYWVRFMSLAFLFGTTETTVPPPLPPAIDPVLQKKWKARLATNALKVGLCWSGNPNSKYDAWRTVPFSAMAQLIEAMPGVQFYSLQLGVREHDRAELARMVDAGRVIDLAGELTDFAQTAHVMRELDCMVTVDTSVAHMAGAVGVKTLVMLTAFRTYWLWITKLATSPWYPSIRVFRQEHEGKWFDVIGKIAAELQKFRAQRAA